MKTLVIMPCVAGAPATGALAAVTAVQALGPLELLVCGGGASGAAPALARLAGVERVWVLDADEPPAPEALVPLLQALRQQQGCDTVAAAGLAWCRALLPRLAAALDVMAVTEVVAWPEAGTVVRPVHAGAALMTLALDEPVRVVAVRSSAFGPPQAGDGAAAPVDTLTPPPAAGPVLLARQVAAGDGAVDLGAARVVVSGGRGTGSAEGFARLQPLARRLGAAVGASRAAVDAGYAAPEQQVGQTGKSVAPELYLALGISGAVQHWAGMKDSKVIVAVNRDPEAPIFQFADYGLVADLFEVLPELEARLQP